MWLFAVDNVKGRSHPASFVLFAPGDAWGACARHSGVGRTFGARYDTEVYASESSALDAAIRLLDGRGNIGATEARGSREVGKI